MTEVERILAERPEFSADFLKEETRCEFFCDTRRKKIWLVLLDLAMEFDRFCREHGLTWFLVGGSMLGAARHRGFIPWDDDIDAGMPREDYEKLLTLMPEFAAPYELQAPGKTPGYFFTFARLRNVRTSALNPAFALQGFNMGLYLDIFPLDEWEPDGAEPYYNRIRDLCVDNSNFMRRSNPYLSEEGRQRAASWSGRDPMENVREVEALARQFNGTGAAYWSHAVITLDAFRHNYFRRECFDEIVRLPFEDITLPVPAGYDSFLTSQYGDWHAFPPVEKRGDLHSDEDMQPDIPFDEALQAYRKSNGL